jgi:hypothetical protein
MFTIRDEMPVMLNARPIWSVLMPNPPSVILVAQKIGKSSSKAMECNDSPEYTAMLRMIWGVRA